MTQASTDPTGFGRVHKDHPRYKWVALSNTTLGMLMATINASIVLISLPAIFRGIGLDPLAPANVSYLLWMLMGFLLVTAVLVVTFGRLGDMYGRVKHLQPRLRRVRAVVDRALARAVRRRRRGHVADRLARRAGASVPPCSWPTRRRSSPTRSRPTSAGMALGINQVAAIAGSFLGLVLGGVLSEWDWRAVFWVSVPVGVVGTIWAYRSLHEIGVDDRAARRPGQHDVRARAWPLLGRNDVRHPALRRPRDGLDEPVGARPHSSAASALLVVFCVVETRVEDPMFHLSLFRIRAFCARQPRRPPRRRSRRGGLQFMLIIWLQGIWLPLHGYDYESTPLWAGIYLLPLTVGFLVAGPVSGCLRDRYGSRRFAVGGLLVVAVSLRRPGAAAGRLPLPAFAFLTFLNGVGSGCSRSPNARSS